MSRWNKVTKIKQILELESMLNDMKNVTEGINSKPDKVQS